MVAFKIQMGLALASCFAATTLSSARPMRGGGGKPTRERLCAEGEIMSCTDGLSLKFRKQLCFAGGSDVGVTPDCVAKPDDWVKPTKPVRARFCPEGQIMSCDEGSALKFRKQLCFAEGADEGTAPTCIDTPDDWVKPMKGKGKGKDTEGDADADADADADRERRGKGGGKGGGKKSARRSCEQGEALSCADEAHTLMRRKQLCKAEPQDEEEEGVAAICVEKERPCAEGEMLSCEDETHTLMRRKQLCKAEPQDEEEEGAAAVCTTKPDDWVKPDRKGKARVGGAAPTETASTVSE